MQTPSKARPEALPPAPRRSSIRLKVTTAVLVAAAVGTAIAVGWPRSDASGVSAPPSASVDNEERARVRITLRKGDEDLPAVPGMKFKEGDTVGFLFSSPTVVWGLILSCDERGEIQQLFPSVPAAQLAPSQDVPLRFTMTLGPEKGRQWIVAYFRPGPEPLPAQDLVEGLRKALRDAGPGTPIPPTMGNVEVQLLPVPRE